jgi:two-component system, chemotaxis family, chemotaxis protein CheY
MRCLIVDDSKVIRTVTRKIMEELSFETVEAADGVEALDRCKERMPDAILLDWNMPRVDGLEFLGMLRQMDGGQVPIVVFCTSENALDKIASALKQGANEYIMKPFDSEIIQSKLQQVGLI